METGIEKSSQFILDSLPAVIYVRDEACRILYMNRAAESFTGIPLSKAINMKCSELFGPPGGECCPACPSTALVRTGEPFDKHEMSVRSACGRSRCINKAGRLVTLENGMRAAVILVQDITEKEGLTREALDLRDRIRSLVETAEDCIFIKDSGGTYLFANERTSGLFGKPLQEIIGRTDEELFGREVAVAIKSRDAQILSGKVLKTEETVHSGAGGETRYYDSIAVPVRNSSGEITSICAIVRDVTARRRLEADLAAERDRAEEANRTKTNFIANVSHEIRTPMNGIVGFAEMLFHTDLNPEQRKLLKFIKNSSETLFSIVSDIVDFSNIESGKMNVRKGEMNLRQIVLEIVSSANVPAAEKGLTLSYSFDNNISRKVIGDSGRLRQVVFNLINNAIKFSERGEIKLIVSAVSETASEYVVRFSVSDQGPGIPAESLGRIFTPFSQVDSSTKRRRHGSGLGLVISDNLVRLMGGQKISVKSSPGEGSVFEFALPMGKGAEIELPHGEARAFGVIEKDSVSYNVLIAEDNFINAEMVRQYLELLGHRSRIVENGQLAVDALRAEKFDAVLMDIQMPVMDGHEATREIRRLGMDLPVIALTASLVAGDRESCMRSGMDDHMAKPVNLQELKKVIGQAISRKREKSV